MCNHRLCNSNPGIKGVGVVFLTRYRKNGINVPYATILGQERSGIYKGEFNLPGGKVEPEDNRCLYKAIIREVRQEIKIDLKPDWTFFNKIFKKYDNTTRHFILRNTMIFVGILPRGISRRTLNAKIQRCNNNNSLPWSEREMAQVEWFNAETMRQIENNRAVPSSYALTAVPRALQLLKLEL